MDQNWQTISLDRKETTAPLEKLHECLLSQKASLLVPLLAVPVIPHSHEHVEGVPGEKVEDEDDDLEYTKRRLKNGLPQNHSSKAARIEQHNEVDSKSDSVKTKSLSGCLPSGTHHIISGNLETIEDTLQLSLVNRYFWALGLTHRGTHCGIASFLGRRRDCVRRGCSEPGDYPPGVLLWCLCPNKN